MATTPSPERYAGPPMPPESGDRRRHDPLAALRHRDFSVFVASRFASGTAMTLFFAAVSWHVYDLTGSTFQLGLLGLIRFVPHAALSLVGGAVADTYDRRRIAMVALLAPAIGGSVLAWTSSTGDVSLPLLYGLIFTIAVAAAFEGPARSALLPALVPREIFPNAVTVHSTLQALAFVTGPAVGGLLIASSGVAAAYAANASLLVASLIGLAFVRPRKLDGIQRGSVSWAAIVEGVRFVRSRQAVLGAMTLDMFAVIFGGAQALLPVYAEDILHVGPRGYGLLSASLELGALLMAVLLIVLPPIERIGRALCIAVACFGLATIAFGLSRSFALSVVAYMAVGMADQVSVVARHTLVQLSTPDALRGRVNSVNMVFVGASNQLGAVESGFVAAATSATFAVVSGGIGCLTALGLVAWKLPALGSYRVGGTEEP